MENTETFFYIDVPLQTAMRVVVKRPKGFKKEDVIASIRSDELADCELLTGWECVAESWDTFLDSDEPPFEFEECDTLPSLSDAEMAGASAIFRHLKNVLSQIDSSDADRISRSLEQYC